MEGKVGQTKEERIEKCCAVLLLTVIYIAFFSIGVCLIAKNVLYEKCGVRNGLVYFLLQNDLMVQRESNTEEDGNDIDLAEVYPFEDKEEGENAEYTKAEPAAVHRESRLFAAYEAQIRRLKEKIGAYTGDLFLFQQPCAMAHNFMESLLDWNLVSQNIIFMSNGYMTEVGKKFTESEIKEMADGLEDFQQFLSARGIPLLYANAGSKVCPYDTRLFQGAPEYSNENADGLLTELRKRGMDVLDFREEMQKEGLPWYEYYYRTDHHWTTGAGLWAAGVLAKKLNAEYGFSFDPSFFSPDAYEVDRYENYWLGYYGRKVTTARTALENYDLLLPRYATDYTLYVPENNLRLRGTYSEVLFNRERFDQIASYNAFDHLNKTDAYGCLRGGSVMSIHNHRPTHNEGKKILLIRESFSAYLLTFLASDIEDIDAVSTFSGSIRTYIEKTEPDMVIVLYYINSILPGDWSTLGHKFDFR